MSEILDKTRETISKLSVSNHQQVLQLFSSLRSEFDASVYAAASAGDRTRLMEISKEWTDEHVGVLHIIQVNWVIPAPTQIKSTIANAASHLRSHIRVGMKAVQPLNQLGVRDSTDVAGLFAELRSTFDKDVETDLDEIDLEITRMNWLGRKTGILTWVSLHWVKIAPPELKRNVGEEFNRLKSHVESMIKNRHDAMVSPRSGIRVTADRAEVGLKLTDSLNSWQDELEERRLEIEGSAEQTAQAREQIDLSLPGVERAIGTRHLIRQTYEELQRIFLSIGFSVVEGPEIETPYYNFEALNIPEHHPARDNMDTFYIEGSRGGHLLRTHTSPMQIRTMEKQPPPVRIVVPGKVYRRDNPDSTHGYMFHQIEGLAVDTDITFCDFKGTVEYFVREFLGPQAKTRLRPSYFPFTEPSAEVDATCHVCGGSGCRVCKFSGWIELFGAGMVDPAVYGFVKYDAERLSGFAFGMGVDRLAMMKYGISELPILYQNDVRFLRQFP
ncbi:MAG TPA: phenylalanine--tRNA ligase subunit alpha [Candidatus Acidoferrales bacterium]|nr:phenylalanine--tRNA ligase subunit alpha [Candidatus Acidoferrales bacterium]